MRRLAAAFILLGTAVYGWAQHGAHGGGASHAAPAFHSGAGAPRAAAGVRSGTAPARPAAGMGSSARRGVGFGGPRRPYTGSWRYRRPYVSTYRGVLPYAGLGYYGYPGLLAPGYDAQDDADSDSDAAPEQYADAGGQAMQPDEPQLPPWPYGGAQAAQPAAADQPAEETTTIVFKDGRAPQQIHNYILTRNALFVGGRHQSEIPIDEIDLAATTKVNREAGVDFRLPAALLDNADMGTH